MKVIAYTRHKNPESMIEHLPALAVVEFSTWPERISECDFIVLACSLNKSNWHMLNAEFFGKVKKGVRIINTARGHLIEEVALDKALRNGTVQSVALDVFEVEPLPMSSPLRKYEQCILGSHNASNTADAVLRTSERAIELLFNSLGIK